MADTELNIQISAAGGDAARDEIMKASDALSQTSSSSARLQEQFQHRFQHIGLMLFAGDALRASGLGAETRQVIGGLNTALIAGESAFGAAAGPAFLFVAALTAVAGIVVKLTSHHKDLVDSLDKVVSAQQKAYQSTKDDIELVDTYNYRVGGAGGLLTSLKSLADLQQGALLKSEIQQVAAIRALMEANIQHAHVMSFVADLYELFKGAVVSLTEKIIASNPVLAVNAALFSHMAGFIKQAWNELKTMIGMTQLTATESTKLATKNDQLKVKLDQLLQSIRHGGTDWKTFMKAGNDAFDEVAKAMAATEKANDKAMKKMIDAAQGVAKEFGGAFAKVIVEGEDMGTALQDMAVKMAEKFVESTIEMIIYWTALRAVMSIIPGGTAAFQASATAAYPMIAQTMFSTAATDFSEQALGGDYLVDKPTLFMAGEAGPERASFTPLAGLAGGGTSSSGGGGSTYIGPITVTANGVQDPKKLADLVGQEIVRSIRGQGQLNFSRNG